MADPDLADPAQASLDALLDGMLGGALIDSGGQIAYANPAALRTLGYREDRELFWRPIADLVHPNDRPKLAQHATALAETGRVGSFELHLISRAGHVVLVEATMIGLSYRDAPAVAYLIRDITERRRIEQQLQLADRIASVGTLAAGVAHEINSPLTYVMANLDLVAEQLQEQANANEEVRTLLAEAREGALRISTILRDLKVFARPDEQRITEVDVRPVIEMVSKMAMSEIKNRARFVTDFSPTPLVHANPSQLNQVFLNLLVNAAHAIPFGNVKGNEVRVTTRVDSAGNAVIEVSDTGTGIDFDVIDRIFDPFFTTKDQRQGSGLGLSICHGLVTAMGGELTVDSIVGEGTTFRVTLPPSKYA